MTWVDKTYDIYNFSLLAVLLDDGVVFALLVGLVVDQANRMVLCTFLFSYGTFTWTSRSTSFNRNFLRFRFLRRPAAQIKRYEK